MPGYRHIVLVSLGQPDDNLLYFNLTLSTLFFSLAILLFVFILVSRFRDGINYARRKKMEGEIQDYLSSYTFEDIHSEEDLILFRKKYVLKPKPRRFVMENLLALHKSLIGESAEALQNLYKALGLHSYSKQKLYSNTWSEIAKGIGELAEMDMHEYSELIRSFVNHPHPVLRSVAQVALLKLKKDGLFTLLDVMQEPLLDWQQVQLARATQQAHMLAIPDFKKWLGNHEETIVIFCLRMIAYYGQHNALDQILSLLQNPSSIIREEAVVTLRHLEAFDAVPVLIGMYPHETIEIQLEILKTLPVIGGHETIPFYRDLLQTGDRRLQLAAAKAIFMSSRDGQEKLKSMKNNHEQILLSVSEDLLDYSA
ncbi:HEAT repeat domain-containing protein [Pontibacter sp. MBLB2868]|uniref:HEAT repeat domain-containing protein n=1 Tax=Pontibacter sp. MBLB2868 TaxID=3451555 RepID=UPI003F74B7DC